MPTETSGRCSGQPSGRVLIRGKTALINLHGALHDGSEPGTLKVEISVQNVLEPNVTASAKGQFTSLPIAMANVLARRYQPGFEVSGSLQGNFQLIASLRDGKPDVQASGELVGNQIALRTPHLADTLRIQRMSAPCTIRLEAGKPYGSPGNRQRLGKALVRARSLWNASYRSRWIRGVRVRIDLNSRDFCERLPGALHLHHDLRLTRSTASEVQGVSNGARSQANCILGCAASRASRQLPGRTRSRLISSSRPS